MKHLGKHEILEELGRGAFGTVYLARDTVLDVPGALKVLHPPLMVDGTVVERFHREARLAARLEHPHIVPVYDFGQAEGYFYLAMRYMEGGSLKERLAQGPLPWEEMVRIVQEVAEGLAYAHEQGVVHRDLKPGNILFDARGRAAVTDFGLAKALRGEGDSVSLTMSGGLIGTPAYMAPELWQGQEATPATDQYALACIVYEMVTGKALFQGDTPAIAVMQHVVEGPHFPEQWPEGVPAGLEEVLGKALAKASEERYEDVLACAQALSGLREETDFVSVEDNDGWLVTVQKFAEEEDESISLFEVSPKTWLRPVIGFLKPATFAVFSVAFSPCRRFLAAGIGNQTVRLWRLSDGKLVRALKESAGVVLSVTFSPDGALLAWGVDDGTTRLWRISNDALLHTLTGHIDGITSVRFSPDGHLLATASWDGTVRLWKVADGVLLRVLEGHTDGIESIAFSPDGTMLASGALDGTIRLWRVANGELMNTLQEQSWVNSVAFSPDGNLLASGARDNMIWLWQVSDGQLLRGLEGHTGEVESVAFSPEGTLLASGSDDHTVRLWQVSDGALLRTLKGHNKGVWSVAFSPNGKLLASGAGDGTIRLWNMP